MTQEGVAPAMKIFDSVFQNLLTQAVKSECGPTLPDGTYPPGYLTEREAVQAVVQHQGLVIKTFLCCFRIIFFQNCITIFLNVP